MAPRCSTTFTNISRRSGGSNDWRPAHQPRGGLSWHRLFLRSRRLIFMIALALRRRPWWWTFGVPPISLRQTRSSYLPFTVTRTRWNSGDASYPAERASSFTASMAIRSAKGVAAALRAAGIDASYLQGGIADWIDNWFSDIPAGQDYAGQMGDAGAPEDRPHRLSMADPTFHRSAGGVHLRPDQGRAQGRQRDRAERPTTSTGSNSPMKASAARSTPSCASTASRMRLSTIWPRSSEAPTRPDTIWPRSAAACSPSRSACPRTFRTITKCSGTAW